MSNTNGYSKAMKVTTIVAGGLTSLGIMGAFVWFIGGLAFAPIAIASDMKHMKQLMRDMIKDNHKTRKSMNELTIQMRIQQDRERRKEKAHARRTR